MACECESESSNPFRFPEQDLDPDAVAALPPDIQRELRLAFLASRTGAPPRRAPTLAAGARGSRAPAKRRGAAAPGPMERFLKRRSS